MDITHADIARTLVESSAWRRVHGDKAGEIEQIVYALNAAAAIAAEAERERCVKVCETHQAYAREGSEAFYAFGAAAADIRAP
jgi:hypothetical protein